MSAWIPSLEVLCMTPLLHAHDDCMDRFFKQKNSAVGFKKAFDIVPHARLLKSFMHMVLKKSYCKMFYKNIIK